MSLDIESRIKNIEEIVEENNQMLHKIRRKAIFSFWFGIFKLLIILGVFYYGYKFLEPVLKQFVETYSVFKDTVDTAKEVKTDLNVGIPGLDIGSLLDKLKK